MQNFIHSLSPPSQNHPPKGVTFTGDPSIYEPEVAGILVIREDSFPKQLYLTTGTIAGALDPIGFITETFTGNPYQYTPNGANALLLKTDGNNPSLWMSTGTTPGAVTNVAGATLGYNGSPYNIVAADFIWQLCIDYQNQILYYSSQWNNKNWTALDGLGGGGSS